ncbi:hypothetical protein B0H67DRAFT_477585 [Lasiosphaeris hirsuta]|uniref:Uncharacterized protein n=1 Tax=Lasiosphaeris hirsuta TaxID=260670 RepID=A0AA40E8S4_9PEZI|nr:hypothetical protein B0H67DRAFT_477585 [Lasiosphaeris hirsuta]
MANFPKLIPAFTAHVVIDPPTPIGPTARGGNLVHVAFIPNTGFIRSEPGYPIQLDAVFIHGVDNIKVDPDGTNSRLDVQSAAKDQLTGALVRFSYTGTIAMGGAAGKVLTGTSDAATTGFGEAFTHVVFETGSPALAALQDKVYAGSGRFILEPGKPVTVEYKISEVAA